MTFVTDGVLDTLADEVCGNGSSFFHGLTAQPCTHESGSIAVTGTVEAAAQLLVAVVEGFTILDTVKNICDL